MVLSVFAKAVLEATRKVPCGRITTYGEISRIIGRPRASRAVGSALHKNPYAPAVPCHRVVKAGGQIGGFRKGSKAKIKILAKEGVKVKNGKVVDFEEIIYHWDS
ncbi:MAG: MGMT family protein [Patescibacteria group bacterium]|nr:MGMT family protein [Patescibacteria group bacterium]